MNLVLNKLSLQRMLVFLMVSVSMVLFGCSADYDTFGTSDYNKFNDIAFEEQDGKASVYADEHKIMVTLAEVPDSLDTWDSVTIASLDISSMATFHLVTSKFKEFPSDSAAIDSLAQEVSYANDRLREGDKIRIPSSGIVYLVVVSESGNPSIWQVVVDIPEPKSSSSKKESGNKDEKSSSSSAKDSDKSSSSKKDSGDNDEKSSSSSAKESGKDSSSSTEEPESSSSEEVSPDAPKLLKIQVGEGNVEGEIDQESGKVFLDMDYGTDLDLRDLEVRSLEVSDGASIDIEEGESYDFTRGYKVTLTSDGGERTYTITAGYQYPNSNFNSWVKDDFGNMNDIVGWDNGNNSYAKQLTSSVENGSVIKMESQTAVVKFASGNMLIAYFNPNNVGALGMAGYEDGNELIDFGRPFYGRPKYVEFDIKYTGKGDSCDLYVILEHRSRTSNEGKNVDRKSTDVNTMVASAWYRATTDDSEDDPDVVSITKAKRDGYKTIRLAFKYGEPDEASPIYNSSVFSKNLKHKDGIDNHLDKTDSPDDFDVTHIRAVMASSALGNLYKGSVGATLWVDEMRLIY